MTTTPAITSASASARSITLRALPLLNANARLTPQAAIPPWADGEGFVSISRSSEELSITCLQARVPDSVQADRDWVAFRFVGPFAFGETGIVLSVIRPLSENGIGIFIASTFDGDHLLVSKTDSERACGLLAAAGHTVLPAVG
jgi:hypothetical protein